MYNSELTLQGDQVHIWKVRLPLSQKKVERLHECLDSEERKRSGNFHFPRDRTRFITARGALRTILGSYLNEPSAALRFGYGTHGKPFLAYPPVTRGIAFNLSHCDDMVVIGVASNRDIGVDVEVIRTFPELEDIAEQYLSKEERESLELAEGEARLRLFYHIWTRREAVAKARGLDLSAALSDFQIPTYSPGSGIRFEQKGGCAWCIQDLRLDSSHIAAVCIEGNAFRATFLNFGDVKDEAR